MYSWAYAGEQEPSKIISLAITAAAQNIPCTEGTAPLCTEIFYGCACREQEWYKIASQIKRIFNSLWLEGKYRSSLTDKHHHMGSFIWKEIKISHRKKEKVILTRLDSCKNPSSSFETEHYHILTWVMKNVFIFLFSNLLLSSLLCLSPENPGALSFESGEWNHATNHSTRRLRSHHSEHYLTRISQWLCLQGYHCSLKRLHGPQETTLFCPLAFYVKQVSRWNADKTLSCFLALRNCSTMLMVEAQEQHIHFCC